jgi:hypothetical protein
VTPDEFRRAFPRLYHVTAASQAARIRRLGLRSAASLCEALGVPAEDRVPLLRSNRPRWTPVPAAGEPPAWLRWQGMNDAPLRSRLDPAVAVEDWRSFINGLVFFFGTEAAVRRLRDARDRGKGAKPPQAILAFRTETVLAAAAADAGRGLLLCAFNNGFLDRSAPGNGRRLRRFDDYRPLERWKRGDRPAEIAVERRLPAHINFELLP